MKLGKVDVRFHIALLFAVVSLAGAACSTFGTASQQKTSLAPGSEPANGKELFDLYVSLERAFDPTVAELYDDDALIENARRYPDGQVKTMRLPAREYKSMIRSAMPMAKSRGDTSKYSEITYTDEGGRVRIRTTRYSELKKYSSPMSLLVGEDSSGKWRIFEERSESQP